MAVVGGVDAASCRRDAGTATKLFAMKWDGGRGCAEDPESGAALRFHFDPELIPNVGLWMNFGGWGHPRRPGIITTWPSNCIGAADSVTDAMRNGTAGWLPAHGERRWWLEFRAV